MALRLSCFCFSVRALPQATLTPLPASTYLVPSYSLGVAWLCVCPVSVFLSVVFPPASIFLSELSPSLSFSVSSLLQVFSKEYITSVEQGKAIFKDQNNNFED